MHFFKFSMIYQFSFLLVAKKTIQVESSNSSRIVLQKVKPNISGKYSCEVSADFPSFHTQIASGELQVVGEYRCNYWPPNNDIKLIKYVFNLCHRTHRCLQSQLGFTDTEFPEGDPTIADVKQYYSIGENLEANCTSNSSIPPARLEWWINDLPVYNAEYTIKYKPIADHTTNRETSILGLRLPLTNEHFYRARVKVSSQT